MLYVTSGNVEIAGVLIGGGAVTGAAGSSGTSGGNGTLITEGGGILNQGSLSLFDDRIVGNSVTGGAGGEGTTGAGGEGGYALGGGIYSHGPLTLEKTTVLGNTATSGAGGNTTGTGNGGNSHGAEGGGVFQYGVLTVRDSTIAGNGAVTGTPGTSSGGGASGSAANAVAGAIATQAAPAAIVNSTIAGNSATTPGGEWAIGGIVTANVGLPLTLASDTFAGNRAIGATMFEIANLDAEEAELATAGTIFAAANGNGVNCRLEGATIFDEGHNLEDDAGASCGLSAANADLVGSDPLLQPLGENGGPTQTMALGSGSPAIGAGGQCPDISEEGSPPLATDQRGVPRHNPCDIGAYEAARPAPPGATPPAAPVIANANETHKVWREGSALASFSSAKGKGRRRLPLGTTFSFDLNEAATVTYSFKRTGPVQHRCVEPAKGRHRGRRPCKGLVSHRILTHPGRAGHNELHFFGNFDAGKRLKPGRYTLTIVASANGLTSAPATLRFTIAAAR